jgi:hypothetical protein
MMTPQPQQGIPATTPFTVTLEAQQWNAVLAALTDAPYRVSAPLIQAISNQLQEQASPNGADNLYPTPQPPH